MPRKSSRRKMQKLPAIFEGGSQIRKPMPPGIYPVKQAGMGFFQDFARGFAMPFQAVNSIAPGLIGNLAGAVHPGLGVGAKMLGLGRRRAGARMPSQGVTASGLRF